MQLIKILTTLTIVALFSVVLPQAWAEESQNGVAVEDYFRSIDYSSYGQIMEQSQNFNLEVQPEETPGVNRDVYSTKSKSTKKAFLLSLVLPGAGEFYGESKLKAAAFLGLEALFWYGYFHYDGKGDDKKVEYRTYADANWDANSYRDYLLSEYFAEGFFYALNGDTLDFSNYYSDTARYQAVRANEDIIYNMEESLSVSVRDTINDLGFTHHSVKISDQQYYENIGKYDQFVYGWGGDEFNLLPLIRSVYLGMRKDANDLYDKAKWAVIASMGNHILSAIDAALTVKSYNRKQDRFIDEANLRLRMVPDQDGLSPRAVFTLKFD